MALRLKVPGGTYTDVAQRVHGAMQFLVKLNLYTSHHLIRHWIRKGSDLNLQLAGSRFHLRVHLTLSHHDDGPKGGKCNCLRTSQERTGYEGSEDTLFVALLNGKHHR